MAYHCVALSIEGFVQQVGVSYVPFGYWFYVTGKIPAHKDPAAVDAKLLRQYGIAVSPWVRARRKRAGYANLQYIRYEDFFVLLATPGKHLFYQQEQGQIRDLREAPLRFAGYALSYRGGHSHVRIEQRTFKDLTAYFLEFATRRSKSQLEAALYALPFEPYAPIRSQLYLLLRKLNARRQAAGLAPLSPLCLPLRRRLYRPFASPLPCRPGRPPARRAREGDAS